MVSIYLFIISDINIKQSVINNFQNLFGGFNEKEAIVTSKEKTQVEQSKNPDGQ